MTKKDFAFFLFGEGYDTVQAYNTMKANGYRSAWSTIKKYKIEWLDLRRTVNLSPKKKAVKPKRTTASGCVFSGGDTFWAS